MLRSSLCDYSDAYILAIVTITVAQVAAPAQHKMLVKKVIFKSCAPSTDCISEINNTQIYDAKYINVIMLMHNSIQHSDDNSKTSGTLWHTTAIKQL